MKRATAFTARPQLETLAEAQERNLQRIEALTDRAPDIAAALEECDEDALCCLVICAICSRRYRFRFIRRLLAIARSRPGQHEIATLYLATFPAGKLATANIKREHERLRKRLQRSGLAGSLLIGGTEVGWDSAPERGFCTFTCSPLASPPPHGPGSERRCAVSGQSSP